MQSVSLFLFDKDLRLSDNRALAAATEAAYPVVPVFVFDERSSLNNRQEVFVYEQLKRLHGELALFHSTLYCRRGDYLTILQELSQLFEIKAIYQNEDYSPFYQRKTAVIEHFAEQRRIPYYRFKDRVIFEKDEILTQADTVYKAYSAYRRKWRAKLPKVLPHYSANLSNLFPSTFFFPSKEELGLSSSLFPVANYRLDNLDEYAQERDYPYLDATTHLSHFLCFGILSIRFVVNCLRENEKLLDELIWRDFFLQIMFHYPETLVENFKAVYNKIEWLNDETTFRCWCEGKTGYPLVDAGMRQLNQTGYMHNRIRMVVASFLCKHLLVDWRRGELYFAEKLLDYEPAANVGNWQWVAGTGCDTMPYFRIFNPLSQQLRYDSNMDYIRKWVLDIESSTYPIPIVEHRFARERALKAYKQSFI